MKKLKMDLELIEEVVMTLFELYLGFISDVSSVRDARMCLIISTLT